MNTVRPGRRARGGGASDVARAFAVGQQVLEALLNEGPATHVLRLFLCPHELIRVRITRQHLANALQRKRIELLEPHNRDTSIICLAASVNEIVVDLAAAHHNSLNRVTIADLSVINQRLKSSVAQVVNRRCCGRQSKQALRRHDDERSLHSWPYLSSQQVKVLRRCRRITNL